MSCLSESTSSLTRSVPAETAALNSLLRSSNVRDHNTGGSASPSVTNRDNQCRTMNAASTTMLESGMGASGPLVSTDVQSYFQNLESRQCRTSSVGPSHTLRVEQRLPILRSDGQDSGVEDLGMAGPSSPAGSDVAIKTNLTQKEFMVYRRALLCAQFPVLSSPQPTPSPQETSPYSYPLSPSTSSQSTSFTYLTSRKPQARLTPDKVSLAGDWGIDGRSDEESEEDLLVQNEMLAGLVRGAFQLTEERHQYYDEVITEGTGRKAPARILIEELVSRLSVVENNRHPFYNPQAFESRAYDIWQQNERRHIGQLIETFWQFSLPSPASTMVKSSYWQSVHDEYQDLMIRLIRLDKRLGVNNYSSAMLSSTSRRLLKEFGLRYGVGELYRRIVFLDYLANKDHFECEVWYMEFILKELSRLSSQLPSMAHQTRFVMVRHEFELLLDILNKLHEHSKHGLQGLLSSSEDCSHKSVALVSLLSSVLTLKVQLTGRKGFGLEHYLEGYIKESARQGYHRHKLRLEGELNINTYVSPITAELVSKLIGCVQEDVQLCMDHYQSVFSRYNQNIVKLVTSTFYSNLMTDVNLVCEMSDINEELNSIDQEFLALSQKLSELDVIWKEFIPCHAQQWRQPMLTQAKSWLKIMTKQLTHLVVNVVNTDEFHSEFGKDPTPSEEETAEPRPRQSSILRHSPFSAFKAVNTSREGSPDGVKGHKTVGSQSKVRSKSRKSPSHKSKAEGNADSADSVLYLNGSKEVRRIHSLPDLADHTSHDTPKGLRRNATTSDLEQSSQIRFHDIDAGVVRFSPSKHHDEHEDLECDEEKHSTDSDAQISRPKFYEGELSESGSEVSSCHVQTETDPTTGENNNDVLKISTTETGSLNNNSSHDEKELSSRTSGSSSSERGQEGRDRLSEDVTSRSSVATHLASNDSPEIEVITESGLTDSGGKDHAPPPMAELPGDSSILLSSGASSSGSSIHDQSTTSTRESRNRSATVSFKSKHLEFIEPESTRPDGFSSSLVDVMFMSQRAISFMQKLIGILCPADLEVPVGPDNDFTGSMSIRTFWERMRMMKVELKEFTEETIIKLVCLYANNLLAMDLCAAEKDQVNSLVNEKVLYGVLLNRQESMLSRCRHERESQLPCDYYVNRDTALLCDKHEPVTRQMCVRINNTWSVLCLLPKLADMLQSRLRGRSLSDDQCQHGIYDEPMDHGIYEKSSLAHGDHHAYVHNVLQAQINLLAYKLNLILQEALHVLLSPEFDPLSIADRLQPLTSCLRDHWVSLGQWLTPHCLMLFMNRLWLYLVDDFKKEVEGLRTMKENADSQAMLLSRSISHLIEFLHAKGEGLGIDQLVKPAEHVLNMLQLHSLSSKHLIQLYRRQLLQESESDSTAEPLPREVLQNMYQALHRHRKCFTGDHLVMWLLIHYYKAKDQPSSRRVKYKQKAKQVGQKLLDLGFLEPVISRSYAIPELLQNELAGCSSDGSVTDATPYPAVTIHSYPKSSISRRSQEIGNDSSEDSLESSGRMYRQRRSKRRISDFYSEEMDSSDDSSTSKSEEGIRRTVVLKADVHVSAEVDSDEAGDSKENDASSREQLQDEEEVARPGGEQKEKQSVPLESHSNAPSRKGLQDPPSGPDAPFTPSSGTKESLHPQSVKSVRPSGSRHFTPDSHHFYYFCDVDDQLMHSSSSLGDSTRSFSLRDGQRETKKSGSGDKPHLHVKSQIINADFILGILMCRRKESKMAKNFTRTVPNEYWKEDDSCLCCSCFR